MATAMAATAAERAVLVRRADGGGRGGTGWDGVGWGGTGARGPGRLTAGLSPQEEEFRWLLHDEVHAVLRQLQDILKVRFLAGRPGCGSFPGRRACLPSACCGRDARCADQALPQWTWRPVEAPLCDCPLNHKQPCERGGVGLE